MAGGDSAAASPCGPARWKTVSKTAWSLLKAGGAGKGSWRERGDMENRECRVPSAELSVIRGRGKGKGSGRDIDPYLFFVGGARFYAAGRAQGSFVGKKAGWFDRKSYHEDQGCRRQGNAGEAPAPPLFQTSHPSNLSWSIFRGRPPTGEPGPGARAPTLGTLPGVIRSISRRLRGLTQISGSSSAVALRLGEGRSAGTRHPEPKHASKICGNQRNLRPVFRVVPCVGALA